MPEGCRVQGDHYDAAKSIELKRGLCVLTGRMCTNQGQMWYVCYIEGSDENYIMHVQMHQITTSSTDRRLSTPNGLRFARHTSFEFIDVVSWSDVRWVFVYV